jgi:hypothetical protein
MSREQIVRLVTLIVGVLLAGWGLWHLFDPPMLSYVGFARVFGGASYYLYWQFPFLFLGVLFILRGIGIIKRLSW